MSAVYDCRDAFAQTLVELGERCPRLLVMVNDSVGSSKVGEFVKRFPGRFVNAGIAEQDMIGMAAGLANAGWLPFVCGATCFLTGRALEQIKVDLAYGYANVKLCGMSSGLAYGALGPTHHSIEDLAWTRSIPNLTVIVPADPVETAAAVRAAAEREGPVFLRISRKPVPVLHQQDYRFQIGRASRLRDGKDLTLIATGSMTAVALEAATLLESEGIEAEVLNMSSIQPLDREAVVAACHKTGAILTVEEHSIYGGLGSAVAEVVTEEHPVPVLRLGVPGVFAPVGPVDWLLEQFGLTPQGVAEAARRLIARKRR